MQFVYPQILRAVHQVMTCIRMYQSYFLNSLISRDIVTILISFFEEYLKEKHTEKDVKLLHGVYSNKEITHSEVQKPLSQKSLHSQLYDDFCESNNEINHSSEDNPELLPPILERADEFNRSHIILSTFLNPTMNHLSIESKNEIEMPHISGRIKLSPIQFLELPPIKTQRISSPT